MQMITKVSIFDATGLLMYWAWADTSEGLQVAEELHENVGKEAARLAKTFGDTPSEFHMQTWYSKSQSFPSFDHEPQMLIISDEYATILEERVKSNG